MLGGRCKQLMERRAGRVECSGAPRPALSPALSPAPDLASHALERGSAPVSRPLSPAVLRASALTESQAVETLAR